jgi:predicted unusual protein kinase regulating ubiquinone biosynthesis (AarF/ABC1/UbiB family)
MSAEYCHELAQSPLAVQPLAPSVVRQIFREELGSHLGRSLDCIDYAPVDCTLIAQSHRAKLTTGRPVTVEVLRPEYYVVQSDIRWAGFLNKDVVGEVLSGLSLEDALTDFMGSLRRKTNFSLVKEALEVPGQIRGPGSESALKVYQELSTIRILTLEQSGVENLARFVKEHPLRAITLSHRLCEAWLERALFSAYLPVGPQAQDVTVDENEHVSFHGCEFCVLPSRTRENLWNYLLAAIVDDPDRAAMYLLREMRPRDTRSGDPQSLRSRFRQSAYFAALQPILGADSNALGQLVFQHWQTAREHGYLPTQHLLCFYRGLFSVARMARSLAGAGDHMRQGMEELRATKVVDQIKDFTDWRYLFQNADRFVNTFVQFPKTFDDALTRTSKPQGLFTHGGSDRRSRSGSSVSVVAILLLFMAIALPQVAGVAPQRLAIIALMLAGLILIRDLERR